MKNKKKDLFLSIITALIFVAWVGCYIYAYFFAHSCANQLEAICHGDGNENVCAFSNHCPSPNREVILRNFHNIAYIFLILLIFVLSLFAYFKKVSKEWIVVFFLILVILIIFGNILII